MTDVMAAGHKSPRKVTEVYIKGWCGNIMMMLREAHREWALARGTKGDQESSSGQSLPN